MNTSAPKDRSLARTDPNQGLERFLSRAEVRALTGLSLTTLWREIQAKRFPAPVDLSPNRKGFRARDIAEWMRSRSKGTA
jgi:prophage regulatory protein